LDETKVQLQFCSYWPGLPVVFQLKLRCGQAGAPIDDMLFSFALILSVMELCEFWGRHGLQREKIQGKVRTR